MTGALLRAGSPELGWKDAWGRGKYREGKGTVGRRNGLGVRGHGDPGFPEPKAAMRQEREGREEG